jgi:hypothetical protein
VEEEVRLINLNVHLRPRAVDVPRPT